MAIGADLLVLAIARRLLIKAGFELRAEDADGASHTIGPLEMWAREPRDELEGRSLVEAYATGAGEAVIAAAVKRLLEQRAASGQPEDDEGHPKAPSS